MAALDRTLRRLRSRLALENRSGLLVKVSGNVRDTGTGWLWVREQMSTNTYAPPARLPLKIGVSLPIQENMAVLIGQDETGQSVITGPNAAAAAVQGISRLALNPLDPAARGLIRPEEIIPLLCRAHPALAGYVQVLPGATMFGPLALRYAGGELDLLTTLKPGAGQHRYVVVFISSAGALSAAGSTAQATSSALDTTDIAEALAGGGNALLALRLFRITGADTVIDDSIYDPDRNPNGALDMRDVIGPPTGSNDSLLWLSM